MNTILHWENIALDVDYDFTPYCRGARDRYGVPLEPDTDAEVTINSVVIQDQSGGECDLLETGFLSRSVIDWIEARCLEQASGYELDEGY